MKCLHWKAHSPSTVTARHSCIINAWIPSGFQLSNEPQTSCGKEYRNSATAKCLSNRDPTKSQFLLCCYWMHRTRLSDNGRGAIVSRLSGRLIGQLCGFSLCLLETVAPNYCGTGEWSLWSHMAAHTTCLVVDGRGAFHHIRFCLRWPFFWLTQLQSSSLGHYYTSWEEASMLKRY